MSKEPEVSEYDALCKQIALLRIERDLQQDALQDAWRNFARSLNPIAMVKDSIHNMVTDKELKSDFGTMAMDEGKRLLIGKIMGKNQSLKGYLGAVVVEKIFFSFINRPLMNVIGLLSNLNRKEEDQAVKNKDDAES